MSVIFLLLWQHTNSHQCSNNMLTTQCLSYFYCCDNIPTITSAAITCPPCLFFYIKVKHVNISVTKSWNLWMCLRNHRYRITMVIYSPKPRCQSKHNACASCWHIKHALHVGKLVWCDGQFNTFIYASMFSNGDCWHSESTGSFITNGDRLYNCPSFLFGYILWTIRL